MTDIKIEEIARVLTESAEGEESLDAEQAKRFVSALSGSISHQVAVQAEDPTEVDVHVEENGPQLALGLIEEEDLIDSVSAGTGMSLEQVKKYVSKLDREIFQANIRRDILEVEPLIIDGVGTFDSHAGRIIFKSIAFSHLDEEEDGDEVEEEIEETEGLEETI